MNFSTWFGAGILIALGLILYNLWKLVRSPLPASMQEALEKKEQKK